MRENYGIGPSKNMADPDNVIAYVPEALALKGLKDYALVPLSTSDPELREMLHVGVHGLKAVLQDKGFDIAYWWQLTIFGAPLPAESKKFLTDKGVELVQLETYDQELREEPSS